MATLLVIHHSPTRGMSTLTRSVVDGAHDESIEGVDVDVREALDFACGRANHETILAADGFVIGTTANFGYMSGALKHVFDSTFLQIGGALAADGSGDDSGGGATKGRPYGLYVHGRYDTTGAVRSVQSLVSALGWKQAHGVLDVMGDIDDTTLEAAYELGATLAAVLAP